MTEVHNPKLFNIVIGNTSRKLNYTCRIDSDGIFFYDCDDNGRETRILRDSNNEVIRGISGFLISEFCSIFRFHDKTGSVVIFDAEDAIFSFVYTSARTQGEFVTKVRTVISAYLSTLVSNHI